MSRKNWMLLLPFVLLVRAPIMAPLWLLSRIGELADNAGGWLNHRLPGLEREVK